MKLCGIYLIKNNINNKVYIGKSIDILGRWEQHMDAARLHKMDYDFYKDLVNIENFSFNILELCPEEELRQKEQFYITHFNSLETGYNQVFAIDQRKAEEKMFDEKILKAIDLLVNTDMLYKDIANETQLSENTIANINKCKSHTQYHSYKNNIREECGRKQYYDIGEHNPRSKLTEKQVIEIIELLKYSDLTLEEISKQFNVSRSAINNINTRKNWKHLSQEFSKNIRKEFKELLKRRVRIR